MDAEDRPERGAEGGIPVRRRGRGPVRAGLWVLLSFVLVLALSGLGLLALTGKPIRLPVWAVAEAEARLNRALPLGENVLSLGGVEVTVDRDWVPRLRLQDLRLGRGAGGALLRLPEVRVAFDPAGLLQGGLRPSSVVLSGAAIRLRRDARGRFDLDLGGGMAAQDLGSFAEMLDRIDAAFARPELSALTSVTAEALSLRLEDARAGRVWQVGDGRFALMRAEGALALDLGMTLEGGAERPARALLAIQTGAEDASARLRVTVEDVSARDLAAQAPVLRFLSVLDAPISGKLTAAFDPTGAIGEMEGELSLGAGALHPSPESLPVAFESARIAMGFDPTRERIELREVEVQSRSLRMTSSGQVLVPGLREGLPDTFIGQVAFSQVMVDPEGLFVEPVTFGQGALDWRLRLDPFRLEIGQLALLEEGRRIAAHGWAEAGPSGWRLSADLALDTIRHDRLLALWPVSAVPKTRAWLEENVQEGLLHDVKAALRLEPGQEPRFALGYGFADADVRFIKTLPPIRRGHGYATIEGNAYTMVLDQGELTPPKGGRIDMAGSVFSVLDILQKPAQAEIRLFTRSTLTAALSLLDEKPFNFLTKAGRPVELGEGRAEVEAVLRLPLVRKVRIEDVSYHVEGRLSDVSSEVLVPGKRLTAPALRLVAERSGMAISGKGLIGRVPFDVTWRQKFGPEARGRSRIEGTVRLSPAAVEEFALGLPDGMVSGEGTGRFTLDLAKGEAGRLALDSDLKGLALAVPEIGWRKGAGAGGSLNVAATLGQPPRVTALALEAPGLRLEGDVSLRAQGGGLDRARFTRLRAGDWLEAAVTLIGQGKGRPPAVEVSGGRIDLRNLPERGGGAGRGGGSRIRAALDHVQVTGKIALQGLRGEFSTAGGFNGGFTARVNGGAAVRGTLVPMRGGTGIRITSDDAGGVLAATGIFSNARGGALDLQLVPLGAPGSYHGVARATDFRVRNAPVLAELLSAISVVGILEQLNGSGLVFSDGDAEFRLTPAGVEITRGAAVGASMGVSVAGTFDSRTDRLNLQGVISPIYMLNGIGAILTRKGEGLFGFNYHVGGTSGRPSVSVNPLSILTPGMFREIFRRPVPKLGGQG